ncbi:putative acyl-CoA desaturase [Helianthus annuus]|nr:putative acyl-CoA desaturase [Helianthus annuus]KAJ0697408.1 putative acyl-CoA desaturase [Helianthus annuus]
MLLNAANESEHERIIFSDVMITRKRNLFWGRKWRTLDVRMASGIFSLHVLALFAPSTFSWDAFRYAILFYFLTRMLGVTMCYHRVLAHHSLKLPKWLEYTCAYLGVQSIQA